MSTSDTPEEIELDCLTCNRLVLARVLSSVIPEYDLDPARYNLDGQNSCTAFKVAYCPRCESVAFVESSWTGYGGEFASDPEHVVRYPRDREPLSDDVPESIRRTFEQALKCYRVHAHDASALMCRKTLEALCAELSAGGRTLKSKIDSLADSGRIDPRLAKWADSLRLVGNEAAHEVAIGTSADDARDGLDFVEAIIENVFVLEKKYQEFLSRRSKRAP
jgi:hypothetical protein